MAVNQLDILIRVTGAAQARSALQGIAGAAQQLGLMLGAGGAVAGMVAFGKQAFIMAGNAERLKRATDNLAKSLGASGNAMVEAITSASHHTISSLDAMRMANKAMLLDVVRNENEMRDLARIAVVLGQAMGQDAASSVDDLTTALGRQSPLILDNLGIKINLIEAERRYAQMLGKTVEQLTDAERKQAFMNAAWEKAREKAEQLGGVQIDTIGQLEQLTAAWADFQTEFGKFLTGSGVIQMLTNLVTQLTEGARAWQGVFERGGAGAQTAKAQTLAIASTALAAILPPIGTLEERANWIAQGLQNLGLVSFNAEELQRELTAAAQAEQEQARATAQAASAAKEAASIQHDYAGALKAAGQMMRNLSELERQYNRDREETIATHAARRAQLEQDVARSQAEALADFNRQRERLMRDFMRSQAAAEARYNEERIALAARYGTEAERAEAEHQKRMARMREDYAIQQEDAVAARDAAAFLRNARNYEVSRRRAEEDFAEQQAMRRADYQRQLADMQIAFAQQREQRLAQFQQQLEDMQMDFEYRQARAAEHHAIEMQRIEAEHQERLSQLEAHFDEEKAAERRAFRDRLWELEGFNHEFLELEKRRNEAAKRLLEEALQEMRQERARLTYQPVHGRAAGGYVGYGVYRLGEAGREFVLNAATTRNAELLSGGLLTQDRILAMLAAGRGAVNNFNQTINIGTQGSYAGLLDVIRAQTVALLHEYARS